MLEGLVISVLEWLVVANDRSQSAPTEASELGARRAMENIRALKATKSQNKTPLIGRVCTQHSVEED